jgi:hypothetical protein
MEPANNSSVNGAFPELSTMRVIWGALLVSLGLYVFVAVQKQPTPFVFNLSAANPQNMVEMVISGMAVLMVALAFVLPNMFLIRAKKSVGPQTDVRQMARYYFVPFIVRLALLESCTLYGFAMSFMRRDAMIMLPFVLISIVGYLMSFPTEAGIRASLRGPERI